MSGEDEVYLVHALPGRMRIKLDALKGSRTYAVTLQQQLSQVKEAKEIRINPTTGSILVLYDSMQFESEKIQSALAEALEISLDDLQYKKNPAKNENMSGSPSHAINEGFGTLNDAVSSFTGGMADLRLLFPGLLLILGVRSLLLSEKVSSPLWHDFLWMGFSTYFMLKRDNQPEL